MMENVWDEFARSGYYDGFLIEDRLYQALVRKMVNAMVNCNVVLDDGCGTGNIVIRLAKQGKKVYGIDGCKAMIEKARMKIKDSFESNVVLDVGNIEDLSYIDRFFDGVVSNNVIFCVDRPFQMLREAYRVLVEKGRLAISGPTKALHYEKFINYTTSQFKKEGKWDDSLKEKLKGFIEINKKLRAKRFMNLFSSSELEKVLEDIGFEKIIHSDEDNYLGTHYFIVVEK